MIYLYDKNGKILYEYEDWKRRDVEIDLYSGSLSGKILQTNNLKLYKFVDGVYVEKSDEEKYSEKLITQDKYDSIKADILKQEEEILIQQELRKMALERISLSKQEG